RNRDEAGRLESDRACGEGTALERRHGADRFPGAEDLEDQVTVGPGLDDLHPAEEKEMDPLGRISFAEDRGSLLVGRHLAHGSQGRPVLSLDAGQNGNRVERNGSAVDHAAIIGVRFRTAGVSSSMYFFCKTRTNAATSGATERF